MPTVHVTSAELAAAVRSGTPWVPGDATVLVVAADEPGPPFDPSVALLSAVVVGETDSTDGNHPAKAWCDTIITAGDPILDQIEAQVAQTPIAASALVQLLRGSEERSIDEGLLLESAMYSTLQAGPEFRRWRESRPRKHREEPPGPTVRIERNGTDLTITLDRPHVRNALNSAMRDELADAFRLVSLDDSITSVTLAGNGPDYSSGGDLDEFGSFPDPATAHLVRLTASVGRAIGHVADRVGVMLHGACMGSGIELPAFAGYRVATPTARFGLPELGLGLIPGAGGTWSLPQLIGRHRTALLALTCAPIDSSLAFAWGLVSEISDSVSSS